MTNALVINEVEDGEVKQQTAMLNWINVGEGDHYLGVEFLRAYVMQEFVMHEPTPQDALDDLAMWCGFPL